MQIDSVVHVSDKHKKIYAYNRSIVDLNENIFVVDTINIDIALEKQYIKELSYTIKMPLSV